MVPSWGSIPLAREGTVHLLGRCPEPGASRICPGQAPAPVPTRSRAESLTQQRIPWLVCPQAGAGWAQARATTARRRAPRHTDGLRPSPASSGPSAPPRTADSGHADAHTHLVREAPEVSHVPAGVTSPPQPLRPLASSTCEKPQAAWSTAARENPFRGVPPPATSGPAPRAPDPPSGRARPPQHSGEALLAAPTSGRLHPGLPARFTVPTAAQTAIRSPGTAS